MEIRRATIEDIKEILIFLEEYHKESNLADIPFHRLSVTKVLEYYILHKDCFPQVAINDEKKVYGVLVGGLEPYFFNSAKTYATDLMFISKGAGPTLFRRFKEWAFESGADRLIMGVSSGDGRADAVLELSGMEQVGGMYVLRKESS